MDAPHVRVTRKHLDNPPGIEAQFVPEAGAIAVSFCPEKLNLSKEQHEVLLKIVGDRYQVDGKLVKFEVKDFPFKELNERRALEIVSDLIAYVRVKQA